MKTLYLTKKRFNALPPDTVVVITSEVGRGDMYAYTGVDIIESAEDYRNMVDVDTTAYLPTKGPISLLQAVQCHLETEHGGYNRIHIIAVIDGLPRDVWCALLKIPD